MMDRILKLIERAVIALETLANAKKRIATATERMADQYGESAEPGPGPEPIQTEEPSDTPLTDPPPPETAEPDREALKAQARALGVNFSERTRTNTLLKLIAEAEAAPPTDDEAGEEPLGCVACGDTGLNSKGAPCPICQSVATPVTDERSEEERRQEVREAVKGYAEKHGNTAAREILDKVGNASTMAQLAPEKFAAMLEACK